MSKMYRSLVEKWEDKKGAMSIKDIADYDVKRNLAQLLENTASKDMNGSLLSEGNDAGITTGGLDAAFKSDTTNYGGPSGWGGGDWKYRPVSLALQRRTFPDLFANKVVPVQAIRTPVSLAYALRFTYGKDGTGAEMGWDDMDSYAGYSGNQGATSPVAGTSAYPFNTGEGLLTSAGELLGVTDHRTACNTGCDTSATEWQQGSLRISQTAIEAKTRKLAASYSIESAQDIKAMHNIDIDREMVNRLQYQITAELDRELLARLKRCATDTTHDGVAAVTVDMGATGDYLGRWNGERFMSIIAAINYQAQQIAISTRINAGNFVIVSPDIATALQAAGHQFVAYTQNVNPNTSMASIGKLNGTMEVYRDQYAKTSYALVGYKGPGVDDGGLIYSPYIMGVETRAKSPSDFSERLGVVSRYALTDSLLGSGRYYRLINFIGVSALIPGAS